MRKGRNKAYRHFRFFNKEKYYKLYPLNLNIIFSIVPHHASNENKSLQRMQTIFTIQDKHKLEQACQQIEKAILSNQKSNVLINVSGWYTPPEPNAITWEVNNLYPDYASFKQFLEENKLLALECRAEFAMRG